MSKAHVYKSTKPGYYYIDKTRVTKERFNDSIQRSQRVAEQVRDHGRFTRPIPAPPIPPVPPEIPPEIPPPIKERIWIIHGTARPASDTNARTDKLVSDHYVESDERIGNIDEQEELLNEKYKDWVHFDTYIEEIET